MENLQIIIALFGFSIFGVLYWIGKYLKIEMKYRNYLLEEQNNILRKK
jgi:hypothetical protein